MKKFFTLAAVVCLSFQGFSANAETFEIHGQGHAVGEYNAKASCSAALKDSKVDAISKCKEVGGSVKGFKITDLSPSKYFAGEVDADGRRDSSASAADYRSECKVSVVVTCDANL
ncbi:MAG: hypothetical protein ACXVCY_16810 [Pseudobdellovibrionaceae bacterium]